MKFTILLFAVLFSANLFAQKDSTVVYKKRVLESTEVDILSSYFNQNGDNASVTGGIGNEDLTDVTTTIIVSIPLNDDDVLTIDAGISAYSSASSSNLNPFDTSGASSSSNKNMIGTPWSASSGASQSDVWSNFVGSYSHSSNDRNRIWSANASLSHEFDYSSFGFGGGYTMLFNEKNTEFGVKANLFLDTWNPRYPTELDTYAEVGGNLRSGFFSSADILDEQGFVTNKSGSNTWNPSEFSLINDKKRNTYSFSFSLSQIVGKNAQFSLFFDLVKQSGWLSNPMQRVYFADKPNYFIGNASSIPNYTSPTNKDVFMLADDIERLPDTRFKIPIGLRFNYFLNEVVSLRTYYRYYYDDWGQNSNTVNIELPIKFLGKFTFYPSYRYYDQTAADYFSPFDTHLSTSEFYTSDYDLSKFTSNQWGLGLSYTDIFTKLKIFDFGLKSIDLKYNNYQRSNGLKANFIGFSFKFVMD